MYNLTDTQKNLAKWLVQSVRVGHLDEAFRVIDWGAMTMQGELKFLMSDYRGLEKDLYDIGITKGSLQALVENNLLLCRVTQEEISMSPFHDIQSYTKETWDCALTGSIYTAVDNDFKDLDTPKSLRHKQSPWTSGSFYVFAFVVILLVAALISRYIPLYAIIPIFLFGIMAVVLISAFQLRMDGELNESNLLTLLIETLKRLPLLGQDKTKPPSEK
ncbi:hypothetical protein [Pseudanabaena sp. ABRG5-3]|uniref:hypothetical protein n=1 Tax=Pseudanabaena sp. ABRG5-3 TaxID=685565 RepID=UPI000DC71569|nr:hypothetical protein [Pseudanabaena sp. ABRG5-3]BBC26396.1 hypothetical protein ABRG53_4139 [Pseudanabaena sp. ABRG5-3]